MNHRLSGLAVALALLIPVRVSASGLFDGIWRPDLSTLTSREKPVSFSVINGRFTHSSDGLTDKLKADGRFHPTNGPYIDEASIRIVNDRVILEVDKLHGRAVYITKYRVSANGNELISSTWNSTVTDHKNLETRTIWKRVGPVVTGGHFLSGNWKRVRIITSSDPLNDRRIYLRGNIFSYWIGDRSGFTGIIGGPPVPRIGDNAHPMITITRPHLNTIVSTSSLNGVVGTILTLTALPGGKSIRSESTTVRTGETTSYLLYKR